MIIGMIGLGSDLLLERFGRVLFPWKSKRGGMLLRLRGRAKTWMRGRSAEPRVAA